MFYGNFPCLLHLDSKFVLNMFVSLQGYSTLPGYGKETVRPITIWKGNSFTTISARDPHISGKDSGKGDSDFNDSDSDISGDVHKKESPPTNSECHKKKPKIIINWKMSHETR